MRKGIFLKNARKGIAMICVLTLSCVGMLTGCGANTTGNSADKSAVDAGSVVSQEADVTKITLDKQTAGMYVGKTIQLTASITPAESADAMLTWSSSDETVALVNSEGYVTGVSAGYVNIICKASNGVQASCTVTVKEDEDSKKDEGSDNGGSNTTYVYYGHYNPSYVYNPSDFVFPDSSSRKLSYSEISAKLSSMGGSSVSGSFAQDAINEIYARNGYVFKNSSIRAYYESKPWYYANPNFTTSDFNEVEKYNIDLLTDY